MRERPTKPFKPVLFAIEFTRDPDRLLRGRAEAEINIDGLRVRLRGRRDLYGGVCGPHPARYIGGNRLSVYLDGRDVVLTVIRASTDLTKLAKDMTAFLNGEKPAMDTRDYRLPWRMKLSPWLALGVPFLAIWVRALGGVHNGARFLWFLLAVIVVFLGYRMLKRERLSTRGRVVWLGGVVGGFFLLLGCAWAYRLANPLTVPKHMWQAQNLVAARCSVQMPGQLRPTSQRGFADVRLSVYETYVPEQKKNFLVMVGPANRQQIMQWGGSVNEYLQQRRREFEQSMNNYGGGYGRYDPVKIDGVNERGIQFVFSSRNYNSGRSDEITFVTRIFLVGDRLYILSVSGEDVDAGDPDVQQFFDSFKPQPAMVAVSPSTMGTIEYWNFDNVNNEWNPATGQMRYANVRPADGILNQAGLFDQWDSNVDFSRNGNLVFGNNQPFSMAGWVRTENRSGIVLSMRKGNDPGKPTLQISLRNGCILAFFGPSNNHAQTLLLESDRSVADNEWHHWALTRDANGLFRLYIDGEERSRNQNPLSAAALETDGRTLGCDPFNHQMEQFRGSMDEVGIFNRCLTAEEVGQLGRLKQQ